MTLQIDSRWRKELADEFVQPYWLKLCAFLQEERENYNVYPCEKDVFKAFEDTSLEQVKVVILGQDPYHQAGQAHGLAFSVALGIAVPPSLRNIYKELSQDQDVGGFVVPDHGDLSSWAKQGVFLLNTTLTVRDGQAGSHQNQGWERFTDRVIQVLSEQRSDLVFLLWGKHAHAKSRLIDSSKHLVLTASHPSPLSAYRGFLGCQHFSAANIHLQLTGQVQIDWQV